MYSVYSLNYIRIHVNINMYMHMYMLYTIYASPHRVAGGLGVKSEKGDVV